MGSVTKLFLRVLSKSNKTFVDADFKIVEFKEIRKLMQEEASKRVIQIPQSDYNNLIRKLSNKSKELRFVNQEHNKVLVFPAALKTVKTEELVSEYYSVKCELDSLNKIQSDDEKAVVSVAKQKKSLTSQCHGLQKSKIFILTKLCCTFHIYLTFFEYI